MQKVKIAAGAGQVLTARVPDSWAEVPFRLYLDLARTARPVPAYIAYPTAHAYANEAGCAALARLVGLPSGAALANDVSQLLPIYEAAPWLFRDELPVNGVAAGFTHLGTAYRYAPAAELGAEAAAQREQGLLWLLREADAYPFAVAELLLARLYTPAGAPSTIASLAVSSAALATLPMSLAWPCLREFATPALPALADPAPAARYLAIRPMLRQGLGALEQAAAVAPASGPPPAWRRWLARLRPC